MKFFEDINAVMYQPPKCHVKDFLFRFVVYLSDTVNHSLFKHIDSSSDDKWGVLIFLAASWKRYSFVTMNSFSTVNTIIDYHLHRAWEKVDFISLALRSLSLKLYPSVLIYFIPFMFIMLFSPHSFYSLALWYKTMCLPVNNVCRWWANIWMKDCSSAWKASQWFHYTASIVANSVVGKRWRNLINSYWTV